MWLLRLFKTACIHVWDEPTWGRALNGFRNAEGWKFPGREVVLQNTVSPTKCGNSRSRPYNPNFNHALTSLDFPTRVAYLSLVTMLLRVHKYKLTLTHNHTQPFALTLPHIVYPPRSNHTRSKLISPVAAAPPLAPDYCYYRPDCRGRHRSIRTLLSLLIPHSSNQVANV